MIILNLLFVYPAAIVTLWTVVTLAAARLMQLDKPFPAFLGSHPMMLTLNIADEYLYRRPGWIRASIFLVLGIFPIASLLMLAWMVYVLLGIPTAEAKFRKSRKKVSP